MYSILVSVKEKVIKVTSSKENLKQVTIFDVSGKRLYHNAQESLIQHSETNWTIARPVGLNENEMVGTLAVTYDQKLRPFQISR